MNVKFWEKKKKAPKQKKGFFREWGDAILFAVVAATLIRWATFEAYTIPTPSMEKSLLVGDYLFVSKLHYGPRTPITPLQVPLTHQNIWGTNIPSFSDAIQLPQYRLPGFSDVKNNDVVV
ncbi:MAG: S26 family signal peptidase, partial [Hymenobacteraceae bacterium]|nr:S26 family signal peptidase [Hymenobacteraceae bacterium]